MLSIANVSAGGQAASYYEDEDDYYTKESQDRDGGSQWLGKGSIVSNLSGEVKAEEFQATLSGKMTDGSQIHVGGGKRRGGTDLTFSAPKSVSIQALVIGDSRILDAHHRAVARAVEYLESYARTRDGEVTGNLMVGSFTHTLNRNGDPQLHTHNVAINATLNKDGKWKALDNKFMYDMKMTVGALYRAELARELQELGYGIKRLHADGRFELEGYTEKQVKEFSTRSRDVEAALAKRGLSRDSASAAAKGVATKNTRDAKKDVDRAVLREVWREKADALGIQVVPAHDRPIPQRDRTDPTWWKSEPGAPDPATLGPGVKEAVDFAIDHLTEREAVVEKSRVERFALEHGTGRANAAEILAEIDRRQSKQEIVLRNREAARTKDIARERDILRVESAGKRAFAGGVASTADVESILVAPSQFPLNEGQKEAVRLIVGTTNRVVGVQGRAGTGKTTMLAKVKEIADQHEVAIVGLAPSGKAALELGGAGIDGMTVAKFLVKNGEGLAPGTMIVLDEAGMVSARDMQKLLRIAEDMNARVALVGDTKQLKAVEAGKPFYQLMEAGMPTAVMDEIQRQLNNRYKASVSLAADGRILDALSAVDKNIREIPDDNKRYQEIAKGYAELPAEERIRSMIVAGTNKARSSINAAVREHLGLMGRGHEFATLQRIDLTRAQLRHSEHYAPGHVVQAEREIKRLGVGKGEQLVVRGIESTTGRVTAERANGDLVTLDPKKTTSFSLYEAAKHEFAVGDKVQLTKAINDHHIKNREFADVVAVDAARREMTIRLADGRAVTLNNDTRLHLDHGYASTIHSAQGATVDRIMVDLDTRVKTTNDAAFYVAISRGKRALRLYTNSKGKLPAAVIRSSDKRAALELGDMAGGSRSKQIIPAKKLVPPVRRSTETQMERKR